MALFFLIIVFISSKGNCIFVDFFNVISCRESVFKSLCFNLSRKCYFVASLLNTALYFTTSVLLAGNQASEEPVVYPEMFLDSTFLSIQIQFISQGNAWYIMCGYVLYLQCARCKRKDKLIFVMTVGDWGNIIQSYFCTFTVRSSATPWCAHTYTHPCLYTVYLSTHFHQ